MGKVEKTRFERNWTTFVNPGFLPCLEAAHSKCRGMKPNVVQLRSKGRFFDFRPDRVESRKNTLRIAIPGRRFVIPRHFALGFFKPRAKRRVWNRTSSNCVQNGVASTFFIDGRKSKQHPLGSQFHEVRFHTTAFCPGLGKAQGKKAGMKPNVVQLRSKRVLLRLSSSGRNEATPLGSNSTRSVSYHHFEWPFPSRAKSRVDERRPIAFKTRFFDFPHRGETKKHP